MGKFPIFAFGGRKLGRRTHNECLFFRGAYFGANATPHTIVRGNLYAKPFAVYPKRRARKETFRHLLVFVDKIGANRRVRTHERALTALDTIFLYPFWKKVRDAVPF